MNIVITGCSRGIGKSIVETIGTEHGHTIVGIARDSKSMNELKQSIKGSSFHPVVFDLTNIEKTENDLLRIIQSIIPTVDILINNAGGLHKDSFEKISMAQAMNQFMINFFSPAALIRLLIPMMGEATKSHVVNITSMGGFQGSKKFSGLTYYSASKSALATLTECLAAEYFDKNISFNALALGAVQTDMLAQAFPDYKAPLTSATMGAYIAHFALNGQTVYNGQVLPVTMLAP